MSRLFDYLAAVCLGMNLTSFWVCVALGLWGAALLNLAMASFNFHFSYRAFMDEVRNEPS